MKQRVIILLLGVCMIATLVVGCGNSKNKESEKENVNESEVVTEVESELGTEIESELTEIETETTESQDTETKVEDTTSSEQKENKPSSDKGQSNSGSSNNQQQNNNTKPSGDVYDNGYGEMVSSNPELCSHGHGASGITYEYETVLLDVIYYDTGAYEHITKQVHPVRCTWCGLDMGTYEDAPSSAIYLDKVTDYAGEFARHGMTTNGLAGYATIVPRWFVPNNVNEIGAEIVKQRAGVISSVTVNVDFDTDDYVIFIDKGFGEMHGYDSKGNVYDYDDFYEFATVGGYEYICSLWYATGYNVAHDSDCIWIFVNNPYKSGPV